MTEMLIFFTSSVGEIPHCGGFNPVPQYAGGDMVISVSITLGINLT
jgi:hypothetical protein